MVPIESAYMLLPISPHSNLVPFQRLQPFVLIPPPPFHPNFGVFLLDQSVHVGVSLSRNLKLISREIILEVFQFPTYVITLPERHSQTDRQTTYCAITAHGKNMKAKFGGPLKLAALYA